MFAKATATVIGLLGFATVPWPASAAAAAPVQAIATLDVPRYMGEWYEIAKFPNRFQKKCVANTVAQYTLLTSGRVRVTNRCRLANGEMDEAIGVARQIGAKNSPKLKVRFAPEWLSFLDAVWGDYWVLDIDPAYQLVAVGEPSREYLWVLSRTPTIPAPAYQALLRRLEAQGFDLRKLELSPQGSFQGGAPGR
jgi:apolipoprotein D and lipocalin family protein